MTCTYPVRTATGCPATESSARTFRSEVAGRGSVSVTRALPASRFGVNCDWANSPPYVSSTATSSVGLSRCGAVFPAAAGGFVHSMTTAIFPASARRKSTTSGSLAMARS